MIRANLIFASYLSIIFGILLIAFNKELTNYYEKFANRNGSAFPRFITTTRLILGGVIFIVMGIIRLIESTG